jgi:hypothetical protein
LIKLKLVTCARLGLARDLFFKAPVFYERRLGDGKSSGGGQRPVDFELPTLTRALGFGAASAAIPSAALVAEGDFGRTNSNS